MGPNAPDFYERMIARHSGDSIVVTCVNGLTEWTNEAFQRMSGYPLEECLGRKPGQMLQGPETDRNTVALIREALRDRRPIQTEILNYAKSGESYWIELHITPVFDDDGRHTHYMSIERNISERKALEAASAEILSREKQRQAERALLSQISEWLYSAKCQDELLRVVRRSMEVLMPEAEGSLHVYSPTRDMLETATRWGDRDFPATLDPNSCWALRHGRAYGYGLRAIEFPCDHASETEHPYFCIPIMANGEAVGLMQIVFDSLSLKRDGRDALAHYLGERWNLALLAGEQISLAIANVRLRQELTDQSIRDTLTGLCNRRWLRAALADAIDAAGEAGTPVSVISVDLDHFKQFNDRHGHDAGDVILRETAQAMVAAAAPRGEVCRLGGEEFVVLAPGLPHDAAVELGEDLRTALARIVVPYEGAVLPPVRLSAGVASFPEDGRTLADLMKAGDRALYAAKNDGRDRVISVRDLPGAGAERGPDRARGPDGGAPANAPQGPAAPNNTVAESPRLG